MTPDDLTTEQRRAAIDSRDTPAARRAALTASRRALAAAIEDLTTAIALHPDPPGEFVNRVGFALDCTRDAHATLHAQEHAR